MCHFFEYVPFKISLYIYQLNRDIDMEKRQIKKQSTAIFKRLTGKSLRNLGMIAGFPKRYIQGYNFVLVLVVFGDLVFPLNIMMWLPQTHPSYSEKNDMVKDYINPEE